MGKFYHRQHHEASTSPPSSSSSCPLRPLQLEERKKRKRFPLAYRNLTTEGTCCAGGSWEKSRRRRRRKEETKRSLVEERRERKKKLGGKDIKKSVRAPRRKPKPRLVWHQAVWKKLLLSTFFSCWVVSFVYGKTTLFPTCPLSLHTINFEVEESIDCRVLPANYNHRFQITRGRIMNVKPTIDSPHIRPGSFKGPTVIRIQSKITTTGPPRHRIPARDRPFLLLHLSSSSFFLKGQPNLDKNMPVWGKVWNLLYRKRAGPLNFFKCLRKRNKKDETRYKWPDRSPGPSLKWGVGVKSGPLALKFTKK